MVMQDNNNLLFRQLPSWKFCKTKVIKEGFREIRQKEKEDRQLRSRINLFLCR